MAFTRLLEEPAYHRLTWLAGGQMEFKSIVVGVDGSAEGIHAAVVASRIAQAAGGRCVLVHAARDPWTEASVAQIPLDLAELNRLTLDSARAWLLMKLADAVPQAMLDGFEVRFGSPGSVLADAIREHEADLLVLGGKHHTTIGRWLAGSTTHHAVRTVDIPVLVTGPGDLPARRVLAAVDLSSAARPTIDAAEELAALSGGQLRVIHVVEPLPVLESLPITMDETEVLRRTEAELERSVWPLIDRSDADRLVRRGPVAETLAQASAEWPADVLVVGSHGKGWVDRVLIGSATERLLNRLPASMLIVPVATPARQLNGRRGRPARTPAGTGRGRPG